MALEAQIAGFVARVAAEAAEDGHAGDPHDTSIAALRAGYERFAARWTPARLPAGVTSEDAVFVAPAGQRIALRRYRVARSGPADPGARGTVLFLHGGGFVVGSLASHASIAARLAADTDLDVIAAAYRLAPEHRAPAAHDDACAVTRAALDGALPFETRARPLALAGDSAGGMLAASAAVRFGTRLAALALVYPMLGFEPQRPAAETEAHAPMLTLDEVHAYRRLYWGECDAVAPPAGTVPLAAARFDGLPPLLAVGAEHDPLRDDARVYVERVRAAGGDARFLLGVGLVHGCWRALDLSPGVARLHAEVCRFLRERLAR